MADTAQPRPRLFGHRHRRQQWALREVLAMLVHTVYFRDLDIFGTAAAWMLGYKNKDAEDYVRKHWEHKVWGAEESELKGLGMAFYVLKEPCLRLGIAFRGTILYRINDLKADLKIAAESLHTTPRVQRCRTLALNAIQHFLRTYPGSTTEQIHIAGHSLGAAIALDVGINLVLDHGRKIDTHLFNPPLLTFAGIAALKFLPSKSTPIGTGKRRHSGLGDLTNGVVNLVSPELSAAWEEFLKLGDWTPHFYLNTWDFICLKYIKCFRKLHEKATAVNVCSFQGFLTRLSGKEAKYIMNVVPSAYLYISNKFSGNPLWAHSLAQWHKYPEMELETERAHLLGGRPHLPHCIAKKWQGLKEAAAAVT